MVTSSADSFAARHRHVRAQHYFRHAEAGVSRRVGERLRARDRGSARHDEPVASCPTTPMRAVRICLSDMRAAACEYAKVLIGLRVMPGMASAQKLGRQRRNADGTSVDQLYFLDLLYAVPVGDLAMQVSGAELGRVSAADWSALAVKHHNRAPG
jgi:hypothetical protein